MRRRTKGSVRRTTLIARPRLKSHMPFHSSEKVPREYRNLAPGGASADFTRDWLEFLHARREAPRFLQKRRLSHVCRRLSHPFRCQRGDRVLQASVRRGGKSPHAVGGRQEDHACRARICERTTLSV